MEYKEIPGTPFEVKEDYQKVEGETKFFCTANDGNTFVAQLKVCVDAYNGIQTQFDNGTQATTNDLNAGKTQTETDLKGEITTGENATKSELQNDMTNGQNTAGEDIKTAIEPQIKTDVESQVLQDTNFKNEIKTDTQNAITSDTTFMQSIVTTTENTIINDATFIQNCENKVVGGISNAIVPKFTKKIEIADCSSTKGLIFEFYMPGNQTNFATNASDFLQKCSQGKIAIEMLGNYKSDLGNIIYIDARKIVDNFRDVAGQCIFVTIELGTNAYDGGTCTTGEQNNQFYCSLKAPNNLTDKTPTNITLSSLRINFYEYN